MLKYEADNKAEKGYVFSEKHNKRMKKLFKMAEKAEKRAYYRKKCIELLQVRQLSFALVVQW